MKIEKDKERERDSRFVLERPSLSWAKNRPAMNRSIANTDLPPSWIFVSFHYSLFLSLSLSISPTFSLTHSFSLSISFLSIPTISFQPTLYWPWRLMYVQDVETTPHHINISTTTRITIILIARNWLHIIFAFKKSVSLNESLPSYFYFFLPPSFSLSLYASLPLPLSLFHIFKNRLIILFYNSFCIITPSFSFMNHEINQEEKRKKEIQGVLDHEKTVASCSDYFFHPSPPPSFSYIFSPFSFLSYWSYPVLLFWKKNFSLSHTLFLTLDQKKGIKGANFSEIFFTNCYFSNFHFQTLSNSNSNQSPKWTNLW